MYVRTNGLYPKPWALAWAGLADNTVVSSLTNGTKYDFMVVALINALQSANSQPESATPVGSGLSGGSSAPSMPANVIVTKQVNGGGGWFAVASWNRGATGPEPEAYYIAWRYSPTDEFTDPLATPVGGVTTTMVWFAGYTDYFEIKVSAAVPGASSDLAYGTLDEREG